LPSRAKAYKTKPCRYWTQKGTCARGDACGFIHGDAPEYAGGVEPATPTAPFASHSATYCGVCRLPFVTEDELVEHLWSDAHRDRINVASEWHDGA
jgi:5-methylcytosine-specific restriction endonuclease McrA